MNGGLWECPRLSDPPTEALGVEVAGYADQEAMGDGVDVPPQPAAVPNPVDPDEPAQRGRRDNSDEDQDSETRTNLPQMR